MLWVDDTPSYVMKYVICLFALTLFLLSCDNKSRQTESSIYDDKPIVEQTEPDTVEASVPEESPKAEVKPSVPVSSSSSRPHKSSDYDNMRGFDPASEDDMDDNGMSRYMENNDEEGFF